MRMNIFNPEHDLCMANGDPNFVPPESALKFGRDCAGLTAWIESGEGIIPWGWNAVLKRRLLREGICGLMLPSDPALDEIRRLSNRNVAVRANEYLRENLRDDALVDALPLELTCIEQVTDAVERFGDAVGKAPWSGSGKGLRWLRSGELSGSDIGWCKNVICKQGSVIVERREKVVQDFAMLFHISDRVDFEGYSLFFNDNGMYHGNVLASNEWILSELSKKLDKDLIINVKEVLMSFMSHEFVGRYSGYAGVDMFICEDVNGRYRIAPCVEINVRMTMGLLARRIYDNHVGMTDDGKFRLSDTVKLDCLQPVTDGGYVLTMEYASSPAELFARLESAVALLTSPQPDSQYAVAIFDN